MMLCLRDMFAGLKFIAVAAKPSSVFSLKVIIIAAKPRKFFMVIIGRN